MTDSSPYRFAVLTYTPQLRQMMAAHLDDPEFTMDFFDISYAQPALGAQRLFEKGYEVILVYSTFGMSILRQIGHSIVLVQKTDMDLIKVLLKAREVSDRVGLSVHEDEDIDVGVLETLLGMRIRVIPHSTVENLREGIRSAIAQGIRVLVGGGVSTAMALECNVPCFTIAPNSHSIKLALAQAKSVAKAKREERASAEQLVAILKLFHLGVLCVDQSGEIFFSNAKALEFLRISKKSHEGQGIAPYLDPLCISEVLRDGAPRIEAVTSIHGEDFVVTTLPVTIHARQQGVVAFFSDVASLHTITGRIRGLQRKSGFTAHFCIDDFQGESPAILRLKKTIRLYAGHGAALCIHGETGTGKELLAQALHNAGARQRYPFVAVNCAALPESLLESELFGYEEGAFTGARRGGKPGVFEMAHRGTLFLDEVGDMGHSAQLRLLRTLETRELIRVGGNSVIPVDIRVISASHKPLAELVAAGSFRRDLYYRLAVLRLHIPPLRQRPEDIPLLLADLLRRYGKTARFFTPAMHAAMTARDWPGNVRELRAFVESYLILLEDKAGDEELFFELLQEWESEMETPPSRPHVKAVSAGSGADLKTQLDQARQEIAFETVRRCAWNKRLAAARLGISYNTLWRILSAAPEGEA